MKFNYLSVLFIFFLFSNFLCFSQDKEEFKLKLNKIISQEKYNYQIDTEKPVLKKENSFIKFINSIIDFLKKPYNFLVKYIKILWKTAPALSIMIIAGLSFLLGLFIYWVSKQIDLSFKNSNLSKIIISGEEGHLDYIKELNLAKKLLADKKFKEAVSVMINSLWLFYYHKKIIRYEKSRTNREYLNSLLDFETYDFLKKIIFNAEKAVYYKENIDEYDCEEILGNISEIFAK